MALWNVLVDWLQRKADPKNAVNNAVSSAMGKYLGTNLTGAEREANEWTAMREDTFHQRNVAGMQAAGLNPALMYQNGGSTPNPSASVAPGSADPMSLIQLAMLPAQLRQINAQTKQIYADADLKRTEMQYKSAMTTYQDLLNKSFDTRFEAEINNLTENTKLFKSQQDINKSQQAFIDTETALKNLEKENFNEFRAAQIALLKAQKKEALSDADYKAVQAAFTRIQKDYAKDNQMLMASSEGFGVAMAIASVFGLNISKIKTMFTDSKDWVNKNMSADDIVDLFKGE